jgi:pilus assembly protein Flp/PilA
VEVVEMGRKLKHEAAWWCVRVQNALAGGDDGQGLVEYALVIALVSVALVAALTGLRGGVAGAFTRITGSL